MRQGGGGVVWGGVSVGAGLVGEGGGRVLMEGCGGGGGGRGGGVGEEGAPVEGGGGARDAGWTRGRVRLLPLSATNSRVQGDFDRSFFCISSLPYCQRQ